LDFWEKKLVRDFGGPAVPEDSKPGAKNNLLNRFLDTMFHPLLAALQITFGVNTAYKKRMKLEKITLPTPEEILDLPDYRLVIEDMKELKFFITSVLDSATKKLPKFECKGKTIK
jgi:hypothetical protein